MASLFQTEKVVNGKKIRLPTWRGSYKEVDGSWKQVSLYRDKAASQARLNGLQRDADQRRAGVLTPAMEHAARPLSQHLEDYLQDLENQRVSAAHLNNARKRLTEIITLGGWERLSDITADSMSSVLNTLSRRRVTRAKDKQMTLAVTTVNSFLKHAWAFVHWLADRGRITGNPIRAVRRADERKSLKRRARRALTAVEIRALLAAAPPGRSFIYKFVMLTGLRRNELHHLLVGDVHLEGPHPFLQLRGEQTKNGQSVPLPLHGDLVEELRTKLSGRREGERVFKAVPEVRTLIRDLAKAGIPFIDELGRRVDLHAQRHTYGTLLALSGAPMMVAKDLMRHSDPRLTANVCTHVGLLDSSAALSQVKLLPPPVAESGSQTSTIRCENIAKTFFPTCPVVARPVIVDTDEVAPFDDSQLRAFVSRYGAEGASRLVLTLLDLLGGPNVDTVEKEGPRSSVG